MKKIETREEALQLINDFDFVWQMFGRTSTEAIEALEDFFLTEEQKEMMNNAAYKFALQNGVDPVFAKFYYYESPL